MNCSQIERLLGQYIDGELRPEEAEVVAAHLARCRACQESFSELRNIKRTLQKLPDSPPPDRVRANVMASVRKGRRGQGLLGNALNLAGGIATISLLLTTSLILVVIMANGRNNTAATPQTAQELATVASAPTATSASENTPEAAPTATVPEATPTAIAVIQQEPGELPATATPSPIPSTLAVVVETPRPQPTVAMAQVTKTTPAPRATATATAPAFTPTPWRLNALSTLDTLPPRPLSGQLVWLWGNQLMATGPQNSLAGPIANLDAKDLLVSPDGRLVAYISASTSGKGDELFVMRVDGLQNQRIYSQDVIRGLAWSLNSRSLLFFSGRFAESDRLHLTQIDLAPAIKISTDPSIMAPWAYWSPNRKMIAYIDDNDKEKQIIVIDISNGKQLNRLSVSSLVDGYIDWSGDSSSIQFAASHAGNLFTSATSIWSMPVGANEPQLLYTAANAHIWHPASSFDDQYMLFFLQPVHPEQDLSLDGSDELWLMDKSSKQVRRVTQALPATRISDICWSSDNKHFSYITTSTDDTQLALNIYTSSALAQPADIARSLTLAPLAARQLKGWQWVP